MKSKFGPIKEDTMSISYCAVLDKFSFPSKSVFEFLEKNWVLQNLIPKIQVSKLDTWCSKSKSLTFSLQVKTVKLPLTSVWLALGTRASPQWSYGLNNFLNFLSFAASITSLLKWNPVLAVVWLFFWFWRLKLQLSRYCKREQVILPNVSLNK